MKYVIKNYIPLTIPKSINFNKVTDDVFMIEVNGEVITSVPEHLNETGVGKATIVYIREDECQAVKEVFMSHNKPYPFNIKNFRYNSFTGKLAKGLAPYKAKFINWTGDPGIARMLCSDGRVRLIPTFALKGGGFSLPYDDTNKKMFGVFSNSS